MPFDLSALALDPGNAIALIGVATGLLVAAVQVWFSRRHERFTNTLRVIDRLEDRDMLAVRHRVDDIMEAAKAQNYDFDKLSDDDRAALSNVAKLFGLVGMLARRNAIDTSIIYPGWARNICKTHERMQRYFAWRLTLPGGKALIGDFEWLVKRVQRFMH